MSQISGLLESLGAEISNGNHAMEGFIDDLQMFHDRRTDEEVVGLEEKLKKAEREDQIQDAKAKWELFQKMLTRLQHYPSAQKLFAYFLARINDVFENHICPYAHQLDRQQVDKIIEEKIVLPTIADMGNGFEHFTLTHAHIRGMIYWLADRCFVRWH
ncbi:ABC-three component system protein [Primorskyibacter sp. 2E233]|uniref:ABC-three component system protein n=1 Tax=Primorskyibacter sp. 2E233 TaxID=3413431 RepID=UPI003BF011D5